MEPLRSFLQGASGGVVLCYLEVERRRPAGGIPSDCVMDHNSALTENPSLLSENFGFAVSHLEDPGQVTHVEEVVELGRRRKHLGLHRAPQGDGHLRKVSHDLPSAVRQRGHIEKAAERGRGREALCHLSKLAACL